MIRIESTQRGGKVLQAYLRNAGRGGVQETLVGFRGRYSDKNKTPVALVAAANEFGTDTIPSRPFMRAAIDDVGDELRSTIRARIDPLRMVIDRPLAQRLGDIVKEEIQKKIRTWTIPPNAPATIMRKGRNDPLVDTRKMLNSIQVELGSGDGNFASPATSFFRQFATSSAVRQRAGR